MDIVQVAEMVQAPALVTVLEKKEVYLGGTA